MASIVLSTPLVAALKNALRTGFPSVRSSHLSESIAYALGYRTHAALLKAISVAKGRSLTVTLNFLRLGERLQALGYQAPTDVDFEELCNTVPGLDALNREDSRSGKIHRFEELVRLVIGDQRQHGQPYDWADAFWLAGEAKALGLLCTSEEADLLVETAARLTASTESVWRAEVLSAAKSRLTRLDTKSSQYFRNLMKELGPTKAARKIGVTVPTLDKLVSGGWYGPFFQHWPVNAATLEKARAFLAADQSSIKT